MSAIAQHQATNERKSNRGVINISLQGHQAAIERMRKARNARSVLRRKLFIRAKLQIKTKVLLWNALIRTTLTYALQTQEITLHDQQTIDAYVSAFMGGIRNKFRYKETQKPKRQQTYNVKASRDNILDPQATNHTCEEELETTGIYTVKITNMFSQQSTHGNKNGENVKN